MNIHPKNSIPTVYKYFYFSKIKNTSYNIPLQTSQNCTMKKSGTLFPFYLKRQQLSLTQKKNREIDK